MTLQSPATRTDLAKATLSIVILSGLVASSLWILRPFLPALLWATMLVVATWPLMRSVERQFGGRRWAAVLVMTLSVLLIFVVPLFFAIGTLAYNADTIVAWSKALTSAAIPPPPEWLLQLPIGGHWLQQKWAALAAIDPHDLTARLRPYVGDAMQWLMAQFGSVGLLFVHFLLMLVLAAILYARGESAAAGLTAFARRLADTRGERMARLAGQAIRGVALGVIGTALIQTTMAGLGLALSGIPYPGILTAIAFLLCVAQLGPILVLLPAAGWLYWSGNTTAAVALLVWSVIVGLSDNVIRPVLIRRGADLPLLLIFAGVIGGLIAFGLIGLFVGPVLLAVTYRLLEDWIAETDVPAANQEPIAAGVAERADSDA